ncbi:nicotinamidase/pyrazinamidase [compost metagenome]
MTGLAGYLKAQQITELDICGLATDYCVKFSALDARDMLPNVNVRLISDASRGIDPQAIKDAISEMRECGVDIVTSKVILAD